MLNTAVQTSPPTFIRVPTSAWRCKLRHSGAAPGPLANFHRLSLQNHKKALISKPLFATAHSQFTMSQGLYRHTARLHFFARGVRCAPVRKERRHAKRDALAMACVVNVVISLMFGREAQMELPRWSIFQRLGHQKA